MWNTLKHWRQAFRFQITDAYFWTLVFCLSLLQLFTLSELPLRLFLSPHDSELYFKRAYMLLTGQALGPYDTNMLLKLPGISFWMASLRSLGIPYLLGNHLLYILSGVFFLAALDRCRLNRVMILVIFVFILFCPVTFDGSWLMTLREPLSHHLTLIIFSAMVLIITGIRSRQWPLLSVLVLSFCFSLCLLLREEDSLLYTAVIPFTMVALFTVYKSRLSIWGKSLSGAMLILPLFFALLANVFARSYIQRVYGRPILNEISEGEFPRLLATIRGVRGTRDNRHALITREALEQIRQNVPRLDPVIQRLPPNPPSSQCNDKIDCFELENWNFIPAFREAAQRAGLTPNLSAAQIFYRDSRLDIELACRKGLLNCKERGKGLLPPFELKWTRALVWGWFRLCRQLAHSGIVLPQSTVASNLDVESARWASASLMTSHTDTLAIETQSERESWKNYSPDLFLSLKYWLHYPDVAASPVYGPQAPSGHLGAKIHFQKNRDQGRVWEDPPPMSASFTVGLQGWREKIAWGFNQISPWIILMGLLCLLGRLSFQKAEPLTDFTRVAVIFVFFLFCYSLCIAYVALFFTVQQRLLLSPHVNLVFISTGLIAENLSLLPRWIRAIKPVTHSPTALKRRCA